MSTPYVGEIRMVGFNFAPVGWAFCDGALTLISQNEALFQLIGTTYGGDGQETFALPDLRSRVPIHQGSAFFGSFVIGQAAGSENVTLTAAQLPAHTHSFAGTTAPGTSATPTTSSVPGAVTSATEPIYSNNTTLTAMASTDPFGSDIPHDNLMPYLAVNFIISLFGVFPTQN